MNNFELRMLAQDPRNSGRGPVTAWSAPGRLPWGPGHTVPWLFGALERLCVWAPSGWSGCSTVAGRASSPCTAAGLGARACGDVGPRAERARRGPGQCLSRDGTPRASSRTWARAQVWAADPTRETGRRPGGPAPQMAPVLPRERGDQGP